MLIVGLGNPEKEFRNTPHNLGKEVLNILQATWEKKYNFSEWRTVKKLKSQISKGKINKKEVILAKPLTFMNLSGEAVFLLLNYFKIPYQNLIVVHDDIDLNWGKIRIAKNRGSAGHKGVLSIFEKIETKDFIRIRIGIRPRNSKPKNLDIFVLTKFKKEQKREIKKIIESSAKAVEVVVQEGFKKAGDIFNKKNSR